MKKLLLFLLVFPVIAKSQILDSTIQKRMREAGNELIKYKKQCYLGLGLETGGALMAIIAASSKQEDVAYSNSNIINSSTTHGAALEYVGGIIAVLGFVVYETAPQHVANAGIIFQGNSIIIQIGKH